MLFGIGLMARSAVTHYGGNKCIWRFRMKIDSALKGANALSSNPTGFIRSLGAFEEIYWLFSQTGPKGFAYAAEIEGRTTVDAWRKAIDQVQQRERTQEDRILKRHDPLLEPLGTGSSL
jgi:hypothetical protein